MKQNETNTEVLLGEGHGTQVIKDTMMAALIVSVTINLSILVSWMSYGA